MIYTGRPSGAASSRRRCVGDRRLLGLYLACEGPSVKAWLRGDGWRSLRSYAAIYSMVYWAPQCLRRRGPGGAVSDRQVYLARFQVWVSRGSNSDGASVEGRAGGGARTGRIPGASCVRKSDIAGGGASAYREEPNANDYSAAPCKFPAPGHRAGVATPAFLRIMIGRLVVHLASPTYRGSVFRRDASSGKCKKPL